MRSAIRAILGGPSMRTTTVITVLFLLATLAIATPYQTRSNGETDTNTYISALPSLRTLTDQILRPPYVSLQTLSARDTDIPGSSMTYDDALAPTPSLSNDNSARTSTTTSTHTLPTTTVTITLLATTFRSAVHNGSVVAVATNYSSGAALPTVTLEQAAPGCTAVCGDVDGEGRCREVEGCVKGEGEKFVQTDVIWEFASPWSLLPDQPSTTALAFSTLESPNPNNPIPRPIRLVIKVLDEIFASFGSSDFQAATNVSPSGGDSAPAAATSPASATNMMSSTGPAPSSSGGQFTSTGIGNTESTKIVHPSTTSNQTPGPATTRSLSTQSSKSTTSQGLSIGQASGLAVGCIVVGIIITTLVACCLARRRRQRSAAHLAARSRNRSTVSDRDLDAKSSSTVLKHIERLPPGTTFDALLVRPLPDNELLAMYQRLRDLTAKHANVCLGDDSRSISRRPDASFLRRIDDLLGSQSPVEAQRLAEMLLDSRFQVDGLRYLFAWVILENVKSSGAPETTLLPPEISECMSAMTGLRSDVKGRSALLSKWRQIVRVLMEPTYGRLSGISTNDPRQVNIRELAKKLLEVLQTFLKSNDNELKLQNLTQLLGEGATVGYTFFTQPSEWVFDWTLSRHSNNSELVVFPALLKVTDDHGQVLPVRELREPVTVAITG